MCNNSPNKKWHGILFLVLLCVLKKSSGFQKLTPVSQSKVAVVNVPILFQKEHRRRPSSNSKLHHSPPDDATAGSPAPFFPSEDASSSNPSKTEESTKSSYGSSAKRDGKTFLQSFDEFGQSLKGKATAANSKAASVAPDDKKRKLRYLAQACLCYTAFIAYRGYRGFVVILPAVFRESFRKLEAAVEKSPFDDDGDDEGTGLYAASENKNQVQKPPLWRTRVTITVLASILTVSYVLGGFVRVALQMFRTLRSSKWNVPQSFAAAAEEQERNETKLLKKVNTSSTKKIGDRDV